MFSWFRSKVNADLSFLSADMHSHLLPNLDDGLRTVDDSVLFIEELHHLGYKKLICTPHIIADLYPNGPHTILPRLQQMRELLAEKNIPVQLEAAAEYMIDTDFEQYVKEDKPLLTFGGKYILIEMSYVAPSPNLEPVVFELCLKGLKPILAHPERYPYYHEHFEKYERFIELGCALQVNLLSLSGYYGKYVKNTAEKLLKHKFIRFAGTDMHHINHLNALKQLATKKEFYELVEAAELINKSLL